MTCAAVINIAGLVANLAGVILLFVYGMPFRVRTRGVTHVISSGPPNQDEIRKDWLYGLLGWVGLVLIIVGTLAQIIGAVIV
jgi:hypothetical protein